MTASGNMESRPCQLRKLFSLYLLFINYVSSNGLVWTRDATFDNKFSRDGYNVLARSRFHCSTSCSDSTNKTCVSFFFAPGQRINCQLHDSILTSAVGLTDVPTSKYYILEGASQPITSAAPALVTALVQNSTALPFTCPSDDSSYRTVKLDDGNDFTYRVKKEKLPQAQAAEKCVEEGGFLARVTTVAKMNMLLQLTSCTGYSGDDYYVDGSNAGATNFSAVDSWKMANGDIVPMTLDFWDLNCPNNPTTEHCLRMRKGSGYKWDDCDCVGKAFYSICEKE